MERIAALCDSTTISVADVEECLNLGATSMTTQRPTSLVVDPEEDKQRILSALESAAGNRSLAAKLLGVSRRTLYNKLERLGIE
jgi:transcriptional regulator of acetoin/glycerol metabolism